MLSQLSYCPGIVEYYRIRATRQLAGPSPGSRALPDPVLRVGRPLRVVRALPNGGAQEISEHGHVSTDEDHDPDRELDIHRVYLFTPRGRSAESTLVMGPAVTRRAMKPLRANTTTKRASHWTTMVPVLNVSNGFHQVSG
jgi:hypothetical protein